MQVKISAKEKKMLAEIKWQSELNIEKAISDYAAESDPEAVREIKSAKENVVNSIGKLGSQH